MKKNKGLTIVEMMVSLFIFAIILGAIFSVLATSRSSWNAGASQLSVQQGCRNGLNAMINELRQSGSSVITGVPADGIIYNSITFQIPTAISQTGITWSSNISYSRGGLNGEQLIRSQAGDQRVLANNISILSFSRSAANPKVVNISIKAQKNTFPGFNPVQSDITLNSKIKVRN